MLRHRLPHHARIISLAAFCAIVLSHSPAAAQSTGSVLPAPWESADIGSPALAGEASANLDTFTVKAAGRDIWGSSDQFHFVYQLITGDAYIVARVDSLIDTDPWAKAGVMIRETLSPGSPYAAAFVTPDNGIAVQTRTTAGANATYTFAGANAAPYWVGIYRRGDTFHAYTSPDAVAWRYIGSKTIPMMPSVYIGLAVTSHNTRARTMAVFSFVTTPEAVVNEAPTVQLTAPASGATFTAPATIALSATASDPDGSVAKVEFYQGATLIGRDTIAPYGLSWSGVAAGSYTLSAVATDNQGKSSRSANVSVTVRAPSDGGGSGSSPYGGTPAPVPGTIQAERFDEGGEGVAYHDLTAGNQGKQFRTTDVDIEATSDSGGGYNVGWASAGEWLQYTVNVSKAGTYTLEARVANPGSGGTFHVEANGVNITGPMTVPNTGGWQRWQTITKNVTLSAGVQRLRLVLDSHATSGAVGNFNYIRLAEAAATTQTRAVFEPSPDHASLVVSYLLEIFRAGADPNTATPVAARNLGKPSPSGGVIDVDITADVEKLATGTYFATVSAVGTSGSSRSQPSATFTR